MIDPVKSAFRTPVSPIWIAVGYALATGACGESRSNTDLTGGTSAAGVAGAGTDGGGGGGLGGLRGLGDCVSTPTGVVPCAEAGAFCANNPGCHALELCVANGCSVFSSANCENQPGCTWDIDAGTCVSPSCDAFDAGNCSADAGCYVVSNCEGQPVSCEKLETCAYPGCTQPL